MYKYESKTKSNADLINTFILKTEIIENERRISLKRGIFEGPKYLTPLTQLILSSFFILFLIVPGILLIIVGSFIISSASSFVKIL